jgi:hypothetical protein
MKPGATINTKSGFRISRLLFLAILKKRQLGAGPTFGFVRF